MVESEKILLGDLALMALSSGLRLSAEADLDTIAWYTILLELRPDTLKSKFWTPPCRPIIVLEMSLFRDRCSEQRLHIWPESTATQCGARQQKQKVG